MDVVYHLQHRRCLTNIHRMDAEWIDKYYTNACRTWDPHRRIRVKCLSQLSLLLRRGNVHTWGQKTLHIPLVPCWQCPLGDSGMSSPHLGVPPQTSLSFLFFSFFSALCSSCLSSELPPFLLFTVCGRDWYSCLSNRTFNLFLFIFYPHPRIFFYYCWF